jgi:hypothetical protein
MNYTRPNNPEHEDQTHDILYGALVFSQALAHLLQVNEGVVVEVQGDALDINDTKKVIVYCSDKMVHILPDDNDLPPGQMVWVHDNEDDIKKFSEY